MRWWSGNRGPDAERLALAQKQFDFYAVELKEENPFSKDNDVASVERARSYLKQFAGTERVYAFMLAEAGKNNPPIDFNRQFPGASQAVTQPHIVPGAFSKGGFTFMKDAIAHADRYFNGEPWVLGDQVTGNIDRAALSAGLRDRYYSDFAKQWRTYIKSASVVRYAGLKDATAKLAQLSGNQSPLLELFSLASTNTAVDDPTVAGIFQPVQAVVPPGSTDRFIAPPNQNYMNALLTIQTSLETIADQPGAPSDAAAAQTVNNATQAKVNTRQMAQSFRIDAEGHIEASVQKLLEDPITYLDAMLKSVDAAELNGGGKSLCGSSPPRAQQVSVQFQRHERSHAGRRECAVPQTRRNALDVLRPEAPKGAVPAGHAVRAQPRFQSDGEPGVPELSSMQPPASAKRSTPMAHRTRTFPTP